MSRYSLNPMMTLSKLDVISARRASQGGALVVHKHVPKSEPPDVTIKVDKALMRVDAKDKCLEIKIPESIKKKIKEKSTRIPKKCSSEKSKPMVTKRPPPYSTPIEMVLDLMGNRKLLKSQIKADYNCRRLQEWKAKFPIYLSNLPQTSVLVRWRLYHTLQNYDVETVYNILSRYGDIVSVGRVTANSVVLVFASISVAKRVVHALSTDRHEPTPLVAEWWHPHMNNYDNLMKALSKEKISMVPVDPQVLALIKWRKMQEKVADLIKEAEPDMHYNRQEFRA